MSLKIKFFRINSFDEQEQQLVNDFISSKRVLNINRYFSPANCTLVFEIEYDDSARVSNKAFLHRSKRKSKEEWISELQPEEQIRFKIFDRIRDSISREQNVRHYNIFNNTELACLATLESINDDVIKTCVSNGDESLAELANHWARWHEYFEENSEKYEEARQSITEGGSSRQSS